MRTFLSAVKWLANVLTWGLLVLGLLEIFLDPLGKLIQAPPMPPLIPAVFTLAFFVTILVMVHRGVGVAFGDRFSVISTSSLGFLMISLACFFLYRASLQMGPRIGPIEELRLGLQTLLYSAFWSFLGAWLILLARMMDSLARGFERR